MKLACRIVNVDTCIHKMPCFTRSINLTVGKMDKYGMEFCQLNQNMNTVQSPSCSFSRCSSTTPWWFLPTQDTFHALPFHVAQQLCVIQNLELVVCGGPLFDCFSELF